MEKYILKLYKMPKKSDCGCYNKRHKPSELNEEFDVNAPSRGPDIHC